MNVAPHSPLFVHDFSMDHGQLLERWNVVSLRAAPDRPVTVTVTVGYPYPGIQNEVGISFDVDFSIDAATLTSIFKAMNGAYGAGKRVGESEAVDRMREALCLPSIKPQQTASFD